MGSKSKICKQVISLFPKADNFYDLFGGGFSITHAMLLHRSKDYKQFHFNEIRNGVCEMVKKAISGDYNYDRYKPEWVTREDFEKNKETDIFKKIIWSFGNNGQSYLFGKGIEHQKKSIHMAIVYNEFDDYSKEIFGCEGFKDGFGINEKRLYLKNRLRLLGVYRNSSGAHDQLERLQQLQQLQQHDQLERLQQLQQLQQLEQLERLQQLQQLQQLQRLEQLERLRFYSGSYSDVNIKQNSIAYCDIPYGGTGEYDKSSITFNRRAFFNWAHELNEPVFVSEYNVEDSRFKCIANFKKRSMLAPNKQSTLIKTEKVYVNGAGYKAILKSRQTKQLNR